MLQRTIRRIKSKGWVAVGFYLILGFPTLQTSAEALRILGQSGCDFFETGIPVPSGWSPHTGKYIKQVHRISLLNGVTSEHVLNAYRDYRPNLFILYRYSVEQGFSTLLDRMRSCVDCVLLEWQETDISSYASLAGKWRIPLANAVSPSMSVGDIRSAVSQASEVVYLTLGERTGGRIHPKPDIRRTLAVIKETADVPVICGFGINSAGTAGEIASIPGCDAIVIGTAALKALTRGLQYFEQFVKCIVESVHG